MIEGVKLMSTQGVELETTAHDFTEPPPALKVLIFGTFERRRVPRIDVYEEGLRAHGVEICTLNEPLPLNQDERLAVLRRPWLVHRLIGPMLGAWLRLWRSARDAKPDVVLVGYMAHFDVVLARLRFRQAVIAIDHLVFAEETAQDRRAALPVRLLLRILDRLAISLADVIVVDTREHKAMVPARRQADVAVVPIGVSNGWLSTEARPVSQSPMKVLFFGLFTPLQGTEVIAEAIRLTADEVPAIFFTLIGTGQDYATARRIVGQDDRVSWFDWVDPHDLPAVATEHDVILGIFGEGDKALRVVPNKVVQGAAAGLAVVTSDTATQRDLFGSSAVYVPSGSAVALAEALSVLAADPVRVGELGRCGRELIARERSPSVVIEPLLSLVR